MMLPTHALAGMALALPVAFVAPEAAGIALVAGLVGGVFPDLDLYVGHRRTLHFPVYYSLLAAVTIPIALASPTTLTLAVAAWVLAAAAHCLADVFGGGLELRPWEATADHAVYDHFNGRWIAPKRWVRYDGAPEDLAVSLVLAATLWGAVNGPIRTVVAGALVVAVVYAAVRRVLPTVAERLVGVLPAHLVDYLPARYLDAGDHASPVPHESQ